MLGAATFCRKRRGGRESSMVDLLVPHPHAGGGGGGAFGGPGSGGLRLAPKGAYGISRPSSLGLDIASADHFGPLLDFFDDQLPAVGGRAWERPRTHLGQPCLELRIGKSRVDLLIQPVNDVSRRIFGRAHAV